MTTGKLCLEIEAAKITRMDVAEAMGGLTQFAELIADAIAEVRPDLAILAVRDGNFIEFRMTSRYRCRDIEIALRNRIQRKIDELKTENEELKRQLNSR